MELSIDVADFDIGTRNVQAPIRRGMRYINRTKMPPLVCRLFKLHSSRFKCFNQERRRFGVFVEIVADVFVVFQFRRGGAAGGKLDFIPLLNERINVFYPHIFGKPGQC